MITGAGGEEYVSPYNQHVHNQVYIYFGMVMNLGRARGQSVSVPMGSQAVEFRGGANGPQTISHCRTFIPKRTGLRPGWRW